jgi:AraC-like DNA-binding protein
MELTADAGGVRQFLAYLDHIGLDKAALGIEGLDAALKGSTRSMPVSANHIVKLMARAAEITQRTDLGIQFATWLNPRGFGPLALLAEHCNSFAERYHLIERFIHLENNAISFDSMEEGDEVSLLCDVHLALRPCAHQFIEALVALNVRAGRAMLGETWHPLRVEFAHAAPPSTAAQWHYFRCPVVYGADHHAFVLSASDYRRRLPQGNTELLGFLQNHMAREHANWPADLHAQVETLIAAQLAGGNVSIGQIAALLATSTRTLQRRLAETGADFATVLAFVRMQIVREHLAQPTPLSLARLTHLLGFSEPSVTCRFIKAQTGTSARVLMAKASNGKAPKRGAPRPKTGRRSAMTLQVSIPPRLSRARGKKSR